MTELIRSSEKAAVACGGMELTYGQLLQKIENYYRLLGKKKITKILVYSENRPEYIYSIYAGWKAGAIVVPVDHLATPDELLYIVKDCRPEVIFTSRECSVNVKKALKGLQRKIEIYNFDSIKDVNRPITESSIGTDDADKTALLIYTSGTTGNPKGVMLSFGNLLHNINAVVEVGIYNENECYLVLLPIHHILPLLGSIIAPLMVQAKIAVSPSTTTDDILKTLCDNRVTVMIGVPRLYEVIGKGISDQINSSSILKGIYRFAGLVNSPTFSRMIFGKVHRKFGGAVKYLVCGGAPLDREIGKVFNTLGFAVLEGYGMTETAPMITFPRPDRVKLGTTGQPLPGIDVKIVNGEIIVRGGNVMKGYYNRPEETAAVIKKGWLYTGDLGSLDDENFLTITGRKKEIIVLPNGKNINPVEIEEKIMNSSGLVLETAVFMKENRLQALLRFDRSKKSLSGEEEQKLAFEIISKYNISVSPYKKILKINITGEELPKTRLGKLRRHELQNIDTGSRKRGKRAPEYREYSLIRSYLENETGVMIEPDDHFELDLGLDSLSRAGLIVFLEKTFGIKMKDHHLSDYPDLMKLSAFVKDKKVKLQESIVNWADILREKVNVKLPRSWFTTGIFKYTAKAIFKIFFKVRGSGMEKIPEHPFILAPNHQSFLDGLFVAIFLRRRVLKNTFFYAKSDHVSNRLIKFLAGVNNVIVVDISNDLMGSIQKLAEVLKNGKSIMIFPEGTRTRDGLLGEFKQTFAILSSELQVPVVPVAIKGAYEVLPKGKKFPRLFRNVTVEFLDPVLPGKRSYDRIADAVRSSIAKSIGE